MNVIAQLEFKLAHYDSTVYRFNHYITKTPLPQHYDDKRFDSHFCSAFGWGWLILDWGKVSGVVGITRMLFALVLDLF